MGMDVHAYEGDGVLPDTFYVVGPSLDDTYKTFTGLLHGGFLFPGLRAHIFAITHR